MYKILIVEDDPTIAESVAKTLMKWDYEAKYLTDFKDVLAEFANFNPHLVLLDISLPFMNGYHWCAEMRKLSKVPIIFLSSANDNMNIVMAMNMGADDFIAKPFDLNVLCAKVNAMIRRTYDFSSNTSLMEHNGLILNLGDATLSYREQKSELSKNEFKILQLLLENNGKIVSRDAMMRRLWDNEQFIDDNTLTVNMTRLRKKLEALGLFDFILTKKGLGYMVQ
ncbi:MAG TPA: response regulator transcription factor [Clostridiales bacterium]|nr:response regulator transcription factor [Clostridiales bacterium]